MSPFQTFHPNKLENIGEAIENLSTDYVCGNVKELLLVFLSIIMILWVFFKFYFLFFIVDSFIHMCIHCLGHLSPPGPLPSPK
jgi:hypothetical protein